MFSRAKHARALVQQQQHHHQTDASAQQQQQNIYQAFSHKGTNQYDKQHSLLQHTLLASPFPTNRIAQHQS